jgi:6,7-dimethyl-8-ribityllumazine synthase
MKWNTFKVQNAKKGTKIVIVRARFNEAITKGLLDGAKRGLLELGVAEKNIRVVEVPGSFDIPYGIMRGVKKFKPHGVVALGAIIKGETKHDEYIANAVFHTLHELTEEFNRPITCGVITTHSLEQAHARSDESDRNVGYQAAHAAIELLRLS